MDKNKLLFLHLFVTLVVTIAVYFFFIQRAQITAPNYYEKLGTAFLEGQTHLLDPVPEDLLTVTNPYNHGERMRAGLSYHWFFRYDTASPNRYLWDSVFYDGKYYLYFGPAPAIVPWMPIRLLLGYSLSDKSLCLIYALFASMALTVLLYSATREILIRQSHLLLSVLWFAAALPLCFGTVIPQFLKRPMFYEAAISGAYAFNAIGLLLLWLAYKHRSKISLKILASLCFGLAAGCRLLHGLNIIFLFIFWCSQLKKQSFPKNIQEGLILLLPWLGVIAAYACYNYARFGNILETGIMYQLTVADLRNTANFWQFSNFINHIQTYLFASLEWRHVTPWSHSFGRAPREAIAGFVMHSPFILWAFVGIKLLIRRKISHPVSTVFFTSLVFGIGVCIFVASHNGIVVRYVIDFLPWLMLPAAIAFLQCAVPPDGSRAKAFILILGSASALWTVYCGIAPISH